MTLNPELEHAYLADYRALETRDLSMSDWVGPIRQQAMGHFRSVGIPNVRHESWRDCDLSLLRRVPFRFFWPKNDPQLLPWDDLGLGSQTHLKLVFVNGIYSKNLSTGLRKHEGIQIGNLADKSWRSSKWHAPFLSRLSGHPDEAFTALNTAFLTDGAMIRVPPGVTFEEPIHVTFVSSRLENHQVVHPRLLVVAEEGSSLQIHETHTGDGTSVYWSNSVTEIFLGDGANVHHTYDAREPSKAIHFNSFRAHQGKDSTLDAVRLNLGGGVVRNDVDVALQGTGARMSLNGLFFGQGTQHLDNRIWIRHESPRTHSSQMMKGVLDDRASGAFAGRVLVHEGAQEIRAQQNSRNLLLSDNACVQAKPELEIYADDVRCTHGATTGQIDENAMFYFQTRGMDPETARRRLVMGFMNEIIQSVKWDPFRLAMGRHLEHRIASSGD